MASKKTTTTITTATPTLKACICSLMRKIFLTLTLEMMNNVSDQGRTNVFCALQCNTTLIGTFYFKDSETKRTTRPPPSVAVFLSY